MPDGKSRTISSMGEMEQRLATVVAEILADKNLALRAALNPMFAMEELGYSFSDDLRASIERRVRFKPEVYERMEALVAEMRRIAGHTFSPDLPEEVDRLLFEELKLQRPRLTIHEQLKPAERMAMRTNFVSEPIPPQLAWTPKVKDPLEELRGAHPIMEPLLEYRAHDASAMRCAPRELYERVRRGEIKLPITRISAVIRPHQGH